AWHNASSLIGLPPHDTPIPHEPRGNPRDSYGTGELAPVWWTPRPSYQDRGAPCPESPTPTTSSVRPSASSPTRATPASKSPATSASPSAPSATGSTASRLGGAPSPTPSPRPSRSASSGASSGGSRWSATSSKKPSASSRRCLRSHEVRLHPAARERVPGGHGLPRAQCEPERVPRLARPPRERAGTGRPRPDRDDRGGARREPPDLRGAPAPRRAA